MCVAHVPVSVQTLVYLESKPFPNQPHRGPLLSGPEHETEDKNTWLNVTGTAVRKDSATVHALLLAEQLKKTLRPWLQKYIQRLTK